MKKIIVLSIIAASFTTSFALPVVGYSRTRKCGIGCATADKTINDCWVTNGDKTVHGSCNTIDCSGNGLNGCPRAVVPPSGASTDEVLTSGHINSCITYIDNEIGNNHTNGSTTQSFADPNDPTIIYTYSVVWSTDNDGVLIYTINLIPS